MTSPNGNGQLDARLETLNAELSAVLHAPSTTLVSGAEACLEDELVVCGILGGKDVGKSTLINALAETTVSADMSEVGRGTDRPKAYGHADMKRAILDRLQQGGASSAVEIAFHRVDAIRSLVLVDLPDFDSQFHDHLRVVRAVAPLLDRIIWVQTPRKIGDRAWVQLYAEVVKDAPNVYCVLNKVDELLADGDLGEGDPSPDDGVAERFWRQQDAWVESMLARSGWSCPADRRFLIAAGYPQQSQFLKHIAQRWGDEEWSRCDEDQRAVQAIAKLSCDDLDRLRRAVLSPVSDQDGFAVKANNRRRELAVNVDRLRHHYKLTEAIDALAAVSLPYMQQTLNEVMGEDYCAAVGNRLRGDLRTDAQLADELLERRVEHWPVLRLLHWPFGWLARIVGRRLGPRAAGADGSIRDPFTVGGITLPQRVDRLRAKILADHAVITGRLKLDAKLPAADRLARAVEANSEDLVAGVEAGLLEEVQQRDRPPSWFKKGLLWLVVLWFPFLQPLAEGALELFINEGGWRTMHGLYRLVSAFSAAHVLTGAAVSLLVLVAILGGMYARGLRAIRKHMSQTESDPLTEGIDDLLVRQLIAPLATPFHDRQTQLTSLQDRLDRVCGGGD